MRRLGVVLGLALALALVACDDDAPSGTGGSAGWSGGLSGGAPDDEVPELLGGLGKAGMSGKSGQPAGLVGASGAGMAADSLCPRYLTCTAATNPPALGALIATYGEGGSCWSGSSASLCEKACRAGIFAAHKAHPEADDCNACGNDADCPGALPVCHEGRCVDCLTSAHCAGQDTPVCDPTTRQCVGCLADAHCQGKPEARLCEPSTRTCVGCLTDEQCVDSGLTKACDPSTHSCRGCQSPAECGPGLLCLLGRCTSYCMTDGECAPGTSCHLDPSAPFGLCLP